MELNNIPNKGQFGDVAFAINSNFSILKDAVGVLQYMTSKNKGLFPTSAALTAAVQSPSQGDWALVGSSFPAALYVCNTNGTWSNSGETYSGDVINLANYLTTSDFSTYTTANNSAVATLQDKMQKVELSVKGKNLFTSAGYIATNGNISSSNEYMVTDFIPILPTIDILVSGGSVGLSALIVAFYDENRAFISGTNNATDVLIGNSSINPLAKYVRFSTTNETVGTFTLHIASAADILLGILPLLEINFDDMLFSGIFVNNAYINTSGVVTTNNDYRCTDLISINKKVDIIVKRGYSGVSSLLVAFYDKNKEFINGVNNARNTRILAENIPSDAVYVRFGTSTETVNQIYISCTSILNEAARLTAIEDTSKYLSQSLGDVTDRNMTLSVWGYYRAESGALIYTENAKNTGLVVLDGRNFLKYKTNLSNDGYAVAFFNAAGSIMTDISIPGGTGIQSGVVDLRDTTYRDAKYACISYYDASQQYVEFVGTICNENSIESRVKELEKGSDSSLSAKLNILIFGDSITDCSTIAVSEHKTTMYKLNGNSNTYNNDGVTITFSMWPYLLTRYLENAEIRNYALSGASYKDNTRTSGNERQNLSYQIRLALNDLDNPNNAFPTVGRFKPDVVIFALGTNDGQPNDDYSSAMAKTVTATGGLFNIEATLENLDRTNFCESARWAFMKVTQAFPTAMKICVLPIQRMSTEQATLGVNAELEKMAKRYAFRIIDGASEIGVVRDFEVLGGVGVLLKDGLHPNEKGQNLMAKRILAEIRNFYVNDNKMNI